jgi:hypothetical protein
MPSTYLHPAQMNSTHLKHPDTPADEDMAMTVPKPVATGTRSRSESNTLTEMMIVAHYLALDLMEYARTADVSPAYEARALAHHLRLWAILSEREGQSSAIF